SQPPLYYVLSAMLVISIDRSDLESYLQENPHARTGVPGSVGNKNMLLHETLSPPNEGTASAVYRLRGFSIFLACVTIFAVYAATSQISGPSYATLAAALTAFNPMFLFISASVNNDNLVIALVSLVLWQVIVMGWHGFKIWRSAFIAIGIALAALTKLSGLVLVPVVLFAAGYIAYRENDQRGFNILFGLSLFAGLVIAGWWYLRNILLYGELFGTEMMVAVAGPRREVFTPLTLWRELWGMFVSYWALFGGVNIPTSEWFYLLMLGLTLVAVAGLVLALNKALPYILRDMGEYGRVFTVTDLLNMYWMYAAAVFAAALALGFIGVVSWTAQTYASQGRLLFPFILAASALTASGLQYYVGHRLRWPLSIGVAVVMGVIALAIPFTSIIPSYTPPPTVEMLPEDATEVYARYGDIELLGYTLPDDRYAPGENVPVTIYWRPLAQTDRDLSAFLTLVDEVGLPVGKVDTYPGAGTLRTSTWEPGLIYEDTYGVPLREDLQRQTDMRLQVGWWHFPTESVIAPVAQDDTALRAVLLDAGAFVGPFNRRGFRQVPRGIIWDNQIQLVGADIDLPTGIRLAWRANRNVEQDYTVFVQLFDERTGEIVAQADRPPALSSSYWQRGDLVPTVHEFTFDELLSPGLYSVYVGWYDSNVPDLARLDLRRDEDDALLISTFSFP
ncbi:MAG: hypothetical protein AAF125_05920, partial [Chloroflexota bacterium]